MNSTEDPARQASGALFDEVVVPLAEARKAAGQQAYFPLAKATGVSSYYDEPGVRVMAPSDFEFPGGGTAEGLVDALITSWTAEGESGLAAMAPRLKEVAEALRAESAEGDGSVNILCYTMF